MEGKSFTYKSLEVLFREYFRSLVFFAIRYVQEQAAAEDIVQDLFVSLYEKRDELDIQLSTRNYLFTSVRNRCLRYLKHKNLGSEYNPVAQKNLHSNPEDPLEQLVVIEFRHKFLQSLESLSPKCRKVFEMSRLEGLSNQEIAEKLSLSKRTVETQISHALKILRKKLGAYLNTAPN